jgi:hypothetical protein
MIYRMEAIALRPATADDVEFCFDLHKLSFHQYVIEVWGWNEDEQRAVHTRNFQPERVQIITANGVDVGSLDVDYGDQETFIWLIELLPSHQSRHRRPTDPDDTRRGTKPGHGGGPQRA